MFQISCPDDRFRELLTIDDGMHALEPLCSQAILLFAERKVKKAVKVVQGKPGFDV
ncbi:hypothetical protein ACPJHQ_13920 [Rossellomorea sp. H39__3]